MLQTAAQARTLHLRETWTQTKETPADCHRRFQVSHHGRKSLRQVAINSDPEHRALVGVDQGLPRFMHSPRYFLNLIRLGIKLRHRN